MQRVRAFWEREVKPALDTSYSVFEKRTKENLWHSCHPAFNILSLCFISALLSAGEEGDLVQIRTCWASLWAHNAAVTIFMSLLYSLFLAGFTLSHLLLVFPSPSSIFPPFPHHAASILAWVIDFCKGWLELLPLFRFTFTLCLFVALLHFCLAASSFLLSLQLFLDLTLVSLFLTKLCFSEERRAEIEKKDVCSFVSHLYLTLTWCTCVSCVSVYKLQTKREWR